MELNIEDLAHLKIWALTHDPPHKSHLIKLYGTRFSEMHKKDALAFRKKILKDTGLERVGLRSELENIIKRADAVASTLDRWILRLRWSKTGYINYNNLHNLFNPDLSVPVELDISKEETTLNTITTDLNNILTSINEAIDTPNKKLLLYNTLYTLLEATWYSRNLLPALADTRVPTHTIFDHLYATTSVINMYLSRSDKPSGFYVLIDFPSIQKFISAARKTGDVWASSWLLSNIMWEIAEHFMNEYGFDVVISPSPRLNPYTLRTLLSALISPHIASNNLKYYMTLEGPEEILRRVKDEKITEAIKKILSIYATTYEVRESEISRLWLQPIIPASITLILPKNDRLKSEDHVMEEITKTYIESWENLIKFVKQTIETEDSEDTQNKETPTRLLRNLLEKLWNFIRLPPQGLNITIVRIEDIYDALLKCIRGVDKDSRDTCDDLELGVNHEKLHALIKEYNLRSDEITQSLLWHVLQTNSPTLSRKKRYGVFYNHVPRPFWVLEADKLQPLEKEFEQERSGWVPCSLCGDEPAYIPLPKKTTGPGQVDFSSKAKETLKEVVGEVDTRELSKIVKPGEALGPYCLVKRATYFAFRSKLAFLSTDDVALSAISEFLVELSNVREEIFNLIAKELSKQANSPHGEFSESDIIKILKYIFKPNYEVGAALKDIYALSQYVFETTYEKFVNELSEKLRKACIEVLEQDSARKIAFLESLRKKNSIESTEIPSKLAKLIKELDPSTVETRRLCNFLKLETTYTIIRGDADNIGKFLTGWRPVSAEYYLNKLLESIKEHGEFITDNEGILKISNDNEVLNLLKENYEVAKQLISALGLENMPISPTAYQALSLTLMLTSLSDWVAVMKRGGVLIYSGGDDILALAPPETALLTTLELRKNFWNGFKKVKNTYVVSAIPTGRSFSVRLANILDNLAEEILKSANLLEERAKKSKWLISDATQNTDEFEKDTLVITSSRVGVEALLPLRLIIEDRELEELTKSTLLLLTLMISKNLPEDYATLIADIERYVSPEALSKIAVYAISRNVSLRRNTHESTIKELMKYFNEVINRLSRINLHLDDERKTAVSEFINLVALMRGFA